MKKLFFIFILILLFGCTSNQPIENKEKPVIAVSSYPIYDFTRNIVDEKDFEIWLMLPPGLNAHSYEPTPKDIVKLQNADVFIYTNPYFELWAEKTYNSVSKGGVYAIDTSKKIRFIENQEEVTGIDPHIWLSPKTAKIMVQTMVDELKTKYPDKANKIEKKSKQYLEEIENLDQRYTKVTSTCEHKEMFVSHAAFGYLARDYNLKQKAIIKNFDPQGEISLADLAELIEEAKKLKTTHIFFEDFISPKLSEQVAKEIGGKTAIFSPIEAYAEKQIEEDSYIKVMNRNLDTLKEALNCEE